MDDLNVSAAEATQRIIAAMREAGVKLYDEAMELYRNANSYPVRHPRRAELTAMADAAKWASRLNLAQAELHTCMRALGLTLRVQDNARTPASAAEGSARTPASAAEGSAMPEGPDATEPPLLTELRRRAAIAAEPLARHAGERLHVRAQPD
jgi:hypothetical protein